MAGKAMPRFSFLNQITFNLSRGLCTQPLRRVSTNPVTKAVILFPKLFGRIAVVLERSGMAASCFQDASATKSIRHMKGKSKVYKTRDKK